MLYIIFHHLSLKGQSHELLKKLQKLEEIIQEHSPLLIAYSGGVDSTLLAEIANEVLGNEQVHCVLVDGPEVPCKEVAEAVIKAENLGLSIEVIPGEPLSFELKQINPHDRCWRIVKPGPIIPFQMPLTGMGADSSLMGQMYLIRENIAQVLMPLVPVVLFIHSS